MTSDHSYNLFQEIDGTLPQDRSRLADVLRTFIAMDRKQQILFQVGKRAGYFLRLGDMPIPDGSSRCGTSAASRTSPRITPMSESTRLSRIACAGGCLFSTGCGLHGKGMEDLNLSAIMELIFPLLVLTIIVRTFIIDTYYSQEKSHAFLLDESIGFVVNQTALKLRTEMARRLKPFGLTPEQWSVLNRLAEQDGISQRELATRTFKDQPTTARILDKLMALAGTAG